ncbi:MAG: esterase family protein [Fimbriimonadaceae bacterium]|nr:esterase family protein [Chitinophagales bacterium]
MMVDNKNDVQVISTNVNSSFLGREVDLTIILPPDYSLRPYPVLWLNDGQDIPALDLVKIVEELFETDVVRHFVIIGIHANEDRMQEYGTLEMADYAKRGGRANLYAEFVVQELMPAVRSNYHVSFATKNNVIAGFSLGALSAIDIAWNYPTHFGRVGVFSGSLWWRKRAVNKWYKDDRDRIIHQVIRNGEKREGLKFWFEAGTLDETSDRNNNGLIDSLDDTVDLIKELTAKGYDGQKDIQFVVVKGGEHNQQTWKEVMPNFLIWAFGRK